MPNDPLGFLAMALAVIAAPGPAVAHVLLSSVVGGRRLASFAICGILTGHCLAMSVSFSLGLLLLSRPDILTTVQLAAAAVLAFLGLRLLRAAVLPPRRRIASRNAWWRIEGGPGAVAGGFVLAVVNPMSLAFFVSSAIGFLDPDLPPWPQSGVLALLYLCAAMLVHGSYAILATRLHDSALGGVVGVQRVLRLAAAGLTLGAAGLIALRAAGYA
ncbi:LysE family translocator [Falsiroseomonas oryzae]|uniref:LysE family translocator n=1 Tax=Falsiroseomonas oryzae TaxID=2766473 RepID=UPI0022EB330F|nr:LysE family transporter [Roseomonas sp. MO-31]